MNRNRVFPQIAGLFLTILLMVWSYSGKAQFQSQITINPAPSAFFGSWDQEPDLIMVEIFNFNETPINVQIVGELSNSFGEVIGQTDVNFSPIISLNPGSTSLSSTQAIAFSSFAFLDSYTQTLDRTRMLPEDNYRLCIKIVAAGTMNTLTEMPGCSDFTIRGLSAPSLIYPADQSSFTPEEVSSLVFQWTPLITSRLKMGNIEINLKIVEILPGQDAKNAMMVNSPILNECLWLEESMFVWPEDMITIPSGTYGWGVYILDGCGGEPIGEPGEVNIISVKEPGEDPEEDLYGEYLLACNQVTYKTEAGEPVSLGMVLENKELFKYPRAVPIRAEGLDYDLIKFNSSGCNGKLSTVYYPVQDQVSAFKWTLEGPGTLNNLPDTKIVKDLLDKLKEAEEELKKINDELDKVGNDITTTLPGKIAKLKKQKEIAEEAKTQKDSLLNSLEGRRDSLRNAVDNKVTELQKSFTKIDSIKLAISEKQIRIDTLESKLEGKPTPGEMALQQRIADIRKRLDGQKETLTQKEENIITQSETLAQNIQNAERDLESGAVAYNTRKSELEGIARNITILETQMMSDPETRDFMLRQKDWRRKVLQFAQLFTSGPGREQVISGQTNVLSSIRASVSVLDQNERQNRFSLFQQTLISFESQLSAFCSNQQGESQQACQYALGTITGSGQELHNMLSTLVSTEYQYDENTQQTIDSLRLYLYRVEASLIPLKNRVSAAEESYQNAVDEYSNLIENLETEKAGLIAAITEIESELKSAESQLGNKVDQRKSTLAKNRESYIEELYDHKSTIYNFGQDLNVVTDSISAYQSDTLLSNNQKREVERDIKKLRKDIPLIEKTIEKLGEDITKIENEIKNLEKKEGELKTKKKEAEDKVKDLKDQIQKKLNSGKGKTADGPLVYYIPPPIEEVIKPALKLEFEQFKKDVADAESELKAAYNKKEAVQKEIVKLLKQVSSDLVTYKKSTEKIPELEKEANELEDEIKTDKTKNAEEIASDKAKSEKAKKDLEALTKKGDSLKTATQTYEKEKAEISKAIQSVKEEIQQTDTERETKEDESNSLHSKFRQEEKALRTAQANLLAASNNLKSEKLEVKNLKSSLAKLRNDLTRASALDDDQAITQLKEEISQSEEDIKTKEDTGIPEIEAHLKQAKEDLNTAKERADAARKAWEDANKEWQKIVKKLDYELKDKLDAKNEEFEDSQSKLTSTKNIQKETDKKVKAGEKKAKDEKDAAEKEAKKKQDPIDKIKKEIDKTKAAQSKADNDIKMALTKKNNLIKKSQDELDTAKKELEKAEKDLRDFLLKEVFEKIDFEVKLKLDADDMRIDKWRSKDKPKPEPLKKTLKYSENRIPDFVGGNTYAKENKTKPPDIKSICLPKYFFEKLEPPAKISTSLIDKAEPRTIALNYQDGKPLWPEWPVIPEKTPLLAKDIVRIKTEFQKDIDQIIYSTVSSSGCLVKKPIHDEIEDTKRYSWVRKKGNVINTNALYPIMFWEAGIVDKSLKEENQEIKPICNAKELAEDKPQEDQIIVPVQAGVMIEVTEKIEGTPDSKHEVQARIVTGDHLGLDAEEIEFEAKLISGESDKWGFDDAKPTKTEPTVNGGYSKVEFSFGDGFAEFEINVKWKRGGKVIQEKSLKAIAPFGVKIHRFGRSAPKFAWDAAMKLFNAGGTAATAVADFPSTTDEEAKEKYGSAVHGVAGLLDDENDFVKAKVLFEISDSEIKIDPEEVETESFGLGVTWIGDLGKDKEYTLTAKVEEKYKDIADEYEQNEDYNTKKKKRFSIGKGTYFVIEMDDAFSPDETVSGSGKLVPANNGMESILEKFKEISLEVEGVEFNDTGGKEDISTASAGTVSWKGEKPLTKEIYGFEFEIESLGITATFGGKITGTLKKKDYIPDPMKFEATVETNGNFLGTISELPEIEVKGFKLKKGSSFTIDMHNDAGVGSFEKEFMGVVINSASLELPEYFSKKDGEKPTLAATEFYIGKRSLSGSSSVSFGGKINYEGTFLTMGYAGYDLKANKANIEFEHGSLKAFEVSGDLALPSPMDGTVGVTIKVSGEKFAAEVTTENPVTIPRLGMTMTLLAGCGVEYDVKKGEGALRLNAFAVSKKFGEVEIKGFEINSKGLIKADEITMDKAIKFSSGFDLHIEKLGFLFSKEEYSMKVTGGFSFPKIGIDQLKGTVTLAPGPSVSIALKSARIEFDRGPVSFIGAFNYSGNEFKGDFEIGIKKILPNGLKGMLVVGNTKDPSQVVFNYWYTEFALGVKMPIAQTGIMILQLGGGLGWNYNPPIGNEQGSPSHNDSFSLKALIGIGTAPGGEVFAGRMEMVLVPGRFTLYGKTWLLDQEESIFGEGQLYAQWNPSAELGGYVRMFIGIPNAEGSILQFDGKVNFLYGNKAYIKSETLSGTILKEIKADGKIEITPQRVLLKGNLGYTLNKKFPLGPVTAIVDVDVSAKGKFDYDHINTSLTASASFDGNWDVDLETPLGTADIVSGSIALAVELKATSSQVSFKGKAKFSYDVWVYDDNVEIDVGYSTNY